MVKAPKGERIWITHCAMGGEPRYITTSKDNDRTWYFLYEIKDDKVVRISKSRNPNDFDKIVYTN